MGIGVRRKDLSGQCQGEKWRRGPRDRNCQEASLGSLIVEYMSQVRESVPGRTQVEQRPSGDMWWIPGLGHGRKFSPIFYNLEQVLGRALYGIRVQWSRL